MVGAGLHHHLHHHQVAVTLQDVAIAAALQDVAVGNLK
ncbi:hypothetical protein RV15_GL000661 [Enterococcus silesiacus]|uniref:Uncharacterized protein n=1 Tax=Enterococcus silesiacus TaxID=332949 RepID=A0AA91GGX9_9ENTE|nr:hypothetical protein RV15_GL000661 [Enterococcus silesiacus]